MLRGPRPAVSLDAGQMKRVGLIGCGAIGRPVARALLAGKAGSHSLAAVLARAGSGTSAIGLYRARSLEEAVDAATFAAPEHMQDNLGAGRGRLPDAAQRRHMVEFFESLG